MPHQDKLENAVQQLLQIAFPELQRPAVKEQDPATEELVKWSGRMYCYSLISHFREMLGSFTVADNTKQRIWKPQVRAEYDRVLSRLKADDMESGALDQ